MKPCKNTGDIRYRYTASQGDSTLEQIAAGKEFDRWLANHDAEVRALALETAASEWQRGAWSNDMPPRDATRVQIISRISQWATDWLWQKADEARREIG